MSGSPRIRRVLLPLFLLALAGTLHGSTVLNLSVEELAARANDVVLGTCASVESHWTDDHQQILTYVTLTGTRTFKGNARGSVTFVRLGGRVDGHLMHVVGAPEFRVGEEVLVFLVRMRSAKPLVHDTDLWQMALGQGKWAVVRDATTGEARAHRSSEGLEFVPRPGQPAEETSPLLSDLIRRVQQAPQRGKGGTR